MFWQPSSASPAPLPSCCRAWAAVGASPAEAASGLLALCIGQGILAIWLGLRLRMPIAIAWSTPGAALLASTGVPAGGFAVAVGAFLVAAALVIVAGLWRPFGRAVSDPHAAGQRHAGGRAPGYLPGAGAGGRRHAHAGPARGAGLGGDLALPGSMPCHRRGGSAGIVLIATPPIPEGALTASLPRPVLLTPAFSLDAIIGIAVPLFIVTMASQNVPGLAVLNANGYRPPRAAVRRHRRHQRADRAVRRPCGQPGGHHRGALRRPRPIPIPPRYIAGVVAGAVYLGLGLFAGFAAAFIAASPPLLIQAVAGLALLGSLAARFDRAGEEGAPAGDPHLRHHRLGPVLVRHRRGLLGPDRRRRGDGADAAWRK